MQDRCLYRQSLAGLSLHRKLVLYRDPYYLHDSVDHEWLIRLTVDFWAIDLYEQEINAVIETHDRYQLLEGQFPWLLSAPDRYHALCRLRQQLEEELVAWFDENKHCFFTKMSPEALAPYWNVRKEKQRFLHDATIARRQYISPP